MNESNSKIKLSDESCEEWRFAQGIIQIDKHKTLQKFKLRVKVPITNNQSSNIFFGIGKKIIPTEQFNT